MHMLHRKDYLKWFWFLVVLCVGMSAGVLCAAEREAESAMQAALNPDAAEQPPPRPASMPDLTRGEPFPQSGKAGYVYWNMGPVGIVGLRNGGNGGDQIQVTAVVPGSPADGKLQVGDVILGLQNRRFTVGGDLNRVVGETIIQAEEEAGQGLLTINIWRDRNWEKRTGARNVFDIDLDEMIKTTDEQGDLYEWQGEVERTAAIKRMSYEEFPIDGVTEDVVVQLEVMGTYSEASPWDCPVVTKARENALKVIVERLNPNDRTRGKLGGTWPDILALVASGKPEYVELAKKWVRQRDLCQDMEYKVPWADLGGIYQSWYHGFDFLEMAIYYDATGDDHVLPEIRKRAIIVAMGQNGGGSWGHSFAHPGFNGGLLNMRNPGYGALNNPGTRCFFLLALARKFGIEHPEVDAAIGRAARFFGTYVDKGTIPYGYHAPWPSDDSNGKNYGAAYAFYVLGRTYEAKYLAMLSANAAFTRRGGHGSWNLWYYTPFSANLAGPDAVKAHMRNMRYFYTLSRRHDGSFVFIGEQPPGVSSGGGGMRNATATYALLLSAPLRQLIITGKDADERMWMSDREHRQLLISVGDPLKDPVSLAQRGKRWQDRSADDILDLLDHFYPQARGLVAQEVGKRYREGDEDILAKLLPLLGSEVVRMRAGACEALAACGKDAVLENLSGVARLLDDPAEVVRMLALRTIAGATDPAAPDRQMMLLKAAIAEYEGESCDHGNLRSLVPSALFADPSMATSPFQSGFDVDLLRSALESVVTLDPGGTIPQTWSRETLVRLAGPVVHAATEVQINDGMFGMGRLVKARALLGKFGYRELMEADFDVLRKRAELTRDVRQRVEFLHGRKLNAIGYFNVGLLTRHPSVYREHLDAMCLWLQDHPQRSDAPEGIWLGELIRLVQQAGEDDPEIRSLRREVFDLFTGELAALADRDARVGRCRSVLADPGKKDFFRKLAAMTHLKELLGGEVLPEIVPYLGHGDWRLRDHAHQLAVELVQNGGLGDLMTRLASARGANAAGMLLVLRDAGNPSALGVAMQALKREEGVVRKAAVQAVMALGGEGALQTVLAFMENATDADDLEGCELALLSRREDAAFSGRVRDEAIARLPKGTVPARRSLAWVLAQLGGADSLAALQEAAATSSDVQEVRNIVQAVSYSADGGADAVLLALANRRGIHLDAVAGECLRRMVGPKGPDDVSDDHRVTFARGILNLTMVDGLIDFLGRVHTGRSIQLLFEIMQKTNRAELAAKTLVAAADGMKNPPPDEARIAADALTQVIEYVEVTRLRGGIEARMGKDDNYLEWKDVQMRAGRALLRLHRPEREPIPTIDALDLDI